MRGCRIKNKRLASSQLVIKNPAQAGIPAFGHPGSLLGCLTHFGVKIDIEVFGLYDLEIKIFVLDLVASEILGLKMKRNDSERKND